MKYCLSSRQTPEYLQLTDQIRVAIQDYKQIYDLIEEYPNKDIILNFVPLQQSLETIKELAKLSKEKLILAVFNLEDIKIAKELNLKYFLAQALQTPEEVRAAKNLGVSWVLIDNYATHSLHQLKIIGVPIRMIPNMSYLDGIPRDNGVAGNWFIPEQVNDYSLYVDVIEFGTQPQKREQTLFRLYAQDKKWDGDLNRIVLDLNYPALNRALDPVKLMRRMNCGMTCAVDNTCTLCYNLLKMSDALKEYNKKVLNKGENN